MANQKKKQQQMYKKMFKLDEEEKKKAAAVGTGEPGWMEVKYRDKRMIVNP